MSFEVLIDLLNSIEADYFLPENRDAWERNLTKIGIKSEDKEEFLQLVEKVTQLKQYVCQAKPKGGFSIRLYNEEEQARINVACRGILLHFEQEGLLPPELRETVIEQIMRLQDVEITENNLRILVILVLFHQSGLDGMLSHYQALAQLKGVIVH